MTRPLVLLATTAAPHQGSWIAVLVDEIAGELGWSVEQEEGPGGPLHPDARVVIDAVGVDHPPSDEPVLLVSVEEGTSRSPVVEESAPHLVPRTVLVVGAFKARRNQRLARAAVERFLERVERERPEPLDPAGELDVAEAVARDARGPIVEENRALLAAVDAWLARTTLTPEGAQVIAADRAILDAAISSPAIDLVIVERAAGRLAAAIA